MADLHPGAAVRVFEESIAAAKGDTRMALALLQGCFVEMALRVAVAEQSSDQQLEAARAFMQLAAAQLNDSVAFYQRGTTEEKRPIYLGKLHNAQQEGFAFATHLRNRFETDPLTRAGAEDRNDSDDGFTGASLEG